MAANQTDKIMEISWEYCQGLYTLEQAVDKMTGLTGLDTDIAEVFLRALNRDNIVRVDFSEKTRNGREARRTIGPGPKIKN